MSQVNRKRRSSSLSLLFLPLLFAASLSHSQQYHGPNDFHGAVKLSIPFPTHYPPIAGGMPPDVLTGYLVFDSLMHIPIRGYQVDSMVNSIYDSDTLRYALKYGYEMEDYDPIAFFQLMEMFPWSGEYLERRPSSLFNRILSRVSTAIPDSGKVLMSLAYADAIVDLTVRDTFSVIDSTKPGNANICEGVNGTINDIIKGQKLPFGCRDSLMSVKGKQIVPASAPGDCLAFQYWLYWLQDIQIPLGVTTYNRTPWCVPDSEYIVFLKFDGLGRDSIQYYASLRPVAMSFSTLMGMYPVRGGIVYDPNNDLGFGMGLTVAEFKSKLRQKILSITSY